MLEEPIYTPHETTRLLNRGSRYNLEDAKDILYRVSDNIADSGQQPISGGRSLANVDRDSPREDVKERDDDGTP